MVSKPKPRSYKPRITAARLPLTYSMRAPLVLMTSDDLNAGLIEDLDIIQTLQLVH